MRAHDTAIAEHTKRISEKVAEKTREEALLKQSRAKTQAATSEIQTLSEEAVKLEADTAPDSRAARLLPNKPRFPRLWLNLRTPTLTAASAKKRNNRPRPNSPLPCKRLKTLNWHWHPLRPNPLVTGETLCGRNRPHRMRRRQNPAGVDADQDSNRRSDCGAQPDFAEISCKSRKIPPNRQQNGTVGQIAGRLGCRQRTL